MIRAPIPALRDGSGRRRRDHRPRWHAGEGGGLLVGPSGRQGMVSRSPASAIPVLRPRRKPCTAKKAEIRRPELNDAGELLGCPEMRDNDYVITTKELAQWMREEQVDFESLTDQDFDSLLGKGSGRKTPAF